MFEYIRHLLAQAVIMLFLGNLALLLMPKPLRRILLSTFRCATVVVKFTTNLLKKVGKEIVANSDDVQKETEKPQPKTKKQPNKNAKSKGKVIQFPNAK